jgi:uncharacterized protein DUF5691
MQFWDIIINTATIGTDKRQVSVGEIPSDLQPAATMINENPVIDKEEKFLQLAAFAFNYRQCGVSPNRQEITISPAPAEDKEYCNSVAIAVLNDILVEESMPLLKFWLEHCVAKERIVFPETIPQLFSIGMQQKKLQTLIALCCGKRGKWLSSFNSDWNFSLEASDEELWQTGTMEQRKEVLRRIRKTEPGKAREWLQLTWAQEDANTKISLFQVLAENMTEEDIPFLESLSSEKSKKVKDEALQLLKQIPGSSIVKEYEELICQAVTIKKEKALLGMLNKTALLFRLPASVPESIFKSGIEKLSGQKNVADEEFIIYQLIACIPPEFWEKHFGCSSAEVMELFKKSEEGKRMIPALGLAVAKFKARGWAIHFIANDTSFYPDLVPLLDKAQKEKYLLKFINNNNITVSVIETASQEVDEWGITLAKAILEQTAKNPYQYNRAFYGQHIHLIPVSIVDNLPGHAPKEEHLRPAWNNISEYINKLILLKTQTIKAFNQ